MRLLKKMRNDYVIWHANRVQLRPFQQDVVVRYNITFAGKVQKVGFRLELSCIAQRMKLTGWVKNVASGDVVAEVQGTMEEINFLVDCMRALKRASVKEATMIEVPLEQVEQGFQIV